MLANDPMTQIDNATYVAIVMLPLPVTSFERLDSLMEQQSVHSMFGHAVVTGNRASGIVMSERFESYQESKTSSACSPQRQSLRLR